ncbi:cytochrome p450 [Fusarium pseudoanthophilum]|uniref:Cytochrome p450 n=1 Tax=Fusarium pseudoanthophilum TaxID=48495 RepID=A0A8H5NYA2_9HYPO|nr:cytochrome p450 [Fusarium pseudoanthophilum]
MASFLVITEYSPLAYLTAAAAALVTLQLLRATYMLYFHPLSKFPGPRSAAISRKWQAKIVNKGFPEKEYERLHKQFGTRALRIGPNHLHITDTSLYKVIYSQTNAFPKEKAFYDTFESHHTTFSETDAQLHKQRRKLLSPLFSKSGVSKLEPLILEKVKETKEKVQRISHRGPINAWPAFRCMTIDIISEFSFGTCINLINEDPDTFSSEYLRAMAIAADVPFLRYYSTTQRLLAKFIPLSIAANFNPVLSHLQKLVGIIVHSYDNYTHRTNDSPFPVLFDNLQAIPPDMQKAEAINTFIAGSDTTAFTLVTALYHILRLPEVEKRLTESVDEIFGEHQATPSLLQLEQTKYLRACINEALRLAMSVPGILPRVVPRRSQPFVVDGKVVPPGTIVGMSAYTMNTDPQIWGQDAHSFNPDRWLGPNAKELETHMCTFSKGARQCIGINVAYAEATIALAHFFYHFKMELKTKELRIVDKFTTEASDPGLLVDFKLRQHA